MSQTSLSYGSPWLSCDHTFKSVGNVGTVRAADNHWIKQYSGLFCVMNADGQVLSWKLTKTLTFEDIQDRLLALRERLQKHGEQVEQFFVDTCCSLRSKLQSIFGPQLKVYLDVFHAVQRITKTLPKRHPYHRDCLKSLQLVFRDPSDHGPVRTKPTPSPPILRQQLLQFQSVWEGISCNGRVIISPAAKKEIRCLLVHIDKGCISGIPPKCGTNRNERLHKDLNSHMKNSRYGVELAYALMTSLFFKHNEHVSASIAKRTPAPINAYCKYSTEGDVECFGLASVPVRSGNPEPEEQPSESKVQMAKLEHKLVQQALSSLEEDGLEEEPSEESIDFEFLAEEAVTVLKQAVSAFYVSVTLEKMSKTANVDNRNIFFTTFMAMVEGLCSSHKSDTQGDQMESLLSSWNLQRVTIPGDGNCLFTSVAFSLVQRIQGGDTVTRDRLLTLQVQFH